jgi:hypothetical protein
MTKHLRFCYETAQREFGETRHAQVVMKELGITYQCVTPQSMSDSFWFWNCENIPDNLPKYISELEIESPLKYVGWGLSKQEALNIMKYKAKGK